MSWKRDNASNSIPLPPLRRRPPPLRVGGGGLGFTLVEMLVAMAITLILMAALARAFGFVGTRIQQSRADTTLASSLRDMTTRLSDELSQCTVDLQPNLGETEDQLGYFVYYEGPLTNATSSLFRAFDDADGNLVLNDSRYGDFDDYIAFTAVAEGNNWFTGKVPRYILDRKAREIDPTYPATPAGTELEPVVIRSKYAEIIYFASPEYESGSLPASPTFTDVDGDTDLNGDGSATENGFPDRLRIHRRVLLIRPDLNIDSLGGRLPVQSFTDTNGTMVNFMQADAWPTANAATVTGAANTNLGWLYGMAGVHQQCDLSLRRVLNNNGLPTTFVAANSLADLSKPHNRFAHVRVPNGVVASGAGDSTTMPLLALGPAPPILSAQTLVSSSRIAPPAAPSANPVITPNLMGGFLRPEFVLGSDLTHLDHADDLWGLERIGEDLLTNNVLGFDVQVYDPEAQFITTYDVSGIPSGPVVGPSDAGYREAVLQSVSRLSNGDPITVERGGYVDLAYPVLAGGSLRGWQPRRLDRRDGMDDGGIGSNRFLVSNFSALARQGIPLYNPAVSPQNWAYQPALYKSGKIVTVGNTIHLFQPTFDTFTSFYERDGFFQNTNPTSPPASPPSYSGTRWTTATSLATNDPRDVDEGSNGLDFDQAFGADDLGERETTPPFINRPESIRVTIRIENPATRQLRQSSVVHRDEL